jgi:hypothetical protein
MSRAVPVGSPPICQRCLASQPTFQKEQIAPEAAHVRAVSSSGNRTGFQEIEKTQKAARELAPAPPQLQASRGTDQYASLRNRDQLSTRTL